MLSIMNLASEISVVLILLLCATKLHRRVDSCNEKDRVPLLIFKQGIIDPSNALSSWSHDQDCCAWTGVSCDEHGRVTTLEFFSSDSGIGQLQGDINLSLLYIEFLTYVKLRGKYQRVTFPNNDDTHKLLNASLVPLTNSSRLQHLDLNLNEDLHIDTLDWLSPLSSLQYLDFTDVDLHKATNWLHSLASLPSLSQLHLQNCQLTYMDPFVKNVNFSSQLKTLDLSHNYFHSEIPSWLFNLSSGLSTLQLSYNNFKGHIPDWSNGLSLIVLDLSWNKFNGSIPDWLGRLELGHLDIGHNLFHGYVPSSLANLSRITHLDISFNSLSGSVSEIIGKHFDFLDLSQNSFTGDLSNTLLTSDIIFLSSNNFKGGLPHISQNVLYLGLAYNSFSGSLSPLLCHSTVIAIKYLDVSYNLLTGEIPDCWMHLTNVFAIIMASNRLMGELPPSMGSLLSLQLLHLQNNSLFGDITWLLKNCTSLKLLNLENNNFSGSIPNISMARDLKMINLRSNQFNGYIPTQLCQLSSMIILDLADNKLSGPIPHCLHNITSMVSHIDSELDLPCLIGIYRRTMFCYNTSLITKGRQLNYMDNTVLVRTIDFSVNNLSGEIPWELFRLVQLQTLNLSHNHLTGNIPEDIGDMKNLESLDLSNNKLSGEIPQTMSILSFLSYMNLSYNNFTGQIPLGTQLQSLHPWSYIGNPMLCGPPLTKSCTNGINPEKPKLNGGNEDDSFRKSLYLGMGVGFAGAFWGVCGSLFFNRTWRHAYFRFLNGVTDKLYVVIILKFNSIRRIRANRS